MPFLTQLCLASAATLLAGEGAIEIRSGLVLESVGRGSRQPLVIDALEAARARNAAWRPRDGDAVARPGGGEAAWHPIEAGADGWFRDRALRGGTLAVSVRADVDQVMLLEASGHAHVRVNGAARAGDVYALGITRLPVRLRPGENEFLFRVGRGAVHARLVPPPATAYLEARDLTLPDVLLGEDEPLLAGVIVGNASDAWTRGHTVLAAIGPYTAATPVPPLPPLATRKVAVRLRPPPRPGAGPLPLELRLLDASGTTLHTIDARLEVRDPHTRQRRTFLSAIDGSVQYYAVTPPAVPAPHRPGLLLTLHGAGVEASGQAAAYAPKHDLVVVAPTNRRPFGFDWEDWGRIDALEVLDLAAARFHTDPRRTWLTGHSMGGHGTWQLGVHHAARFAAIAPSAGWSDFWSYTGAGAYPAGDPIGEILARAANPSRTLLLLRNLQPRGVYVLHGDADDNVPVDQARRMRAELAAFHPDFAYYERPGAGHWWGNACVDWPPLIGFLRERSLPEPGSERTLDWTTVSPGIASTWGFAAVESQTRAFLPSRLSARVEPARVSLETQNVRRLALRRALLPDAEGHSDLDVVIDGNHLTLPWPADGVLRLHRPAEAWQVLERVPAGWKTPQRCGPLKDAFRNRMVFVVGTQGDDAADAWCLAKARFDAETFWYRGNGAVDVVPDAAFDPAAHADRNVILYGNADENAAAAALLDREVIVRGGEVVVGEQSLRGADLGVLAVRPRRDSARASVAWIAASGPAGRHALDLMPVFVSGAGFPDVLVIGAEMLEQGEADVRAAGFFGEDWSVAQGEIAFRGAGTDAP